MKEKFFKNFYYFFIFIFRKWRKWSHRRVIYRFYFKKKKVKYNFRKSNQMKCLFFLIFNEIFIFWENRKLFDFSIFNYLILFF
jgi:hypothetical protein